MNGWAKMFLQAISVVVVLILVVILYDLITDPTSNADILERLNEVEGKLDQLLANG